MGTILLWWTILSGWTCEGEHAWIWSPPDPPPPDYDPEQDGWWCQNGGHRGRPILDGEPH